MKYLSEELENYGPNILLVYGKSSIKKSGLYDDIISVLKKCGKNVTELSGVKSNPTYMQMMEGVRLVKRKSYRSHLSRGRRLRNRLCQGDFRIGILQGRPMAEILDRF